MHETKVELILKYGTKCMICGKDVGIKHIQWHHIRPRYDFKRCGEIENNSINNGSLLCESCHKMVHKYDYNNYKYKIYIAKIMHTKQRGE